MTSPKPRFVIDTGVLVSSLIRTDSPPYQAFQKAKAEGTILFSVPLLTEFTTVIQRPKLQRFINPQYAWEFLQTLLEVVDYVHTLPQIKACRDPKDDKVLELAVGGSAHAIISSDADLWVLHPFQGIPIVSPGEFSRGGL